jgi:hypothetical protein
MACKRKLATGQWWGFCGETDMGQTLPVLCTECGGEYILDGTPDQEKLVADLLDQKRRDLVNKTPNTR